MLLFSSTLFLRRPFSSCPTPRLPNYYYYYYFYLALLLAHFCRGGVDGVGPTIPTDDDDDNVIISSRTRWSRLLRSLPLGLAGSKTPLQPKERDRTLIDMTLAIRSMDFNMETGTFRTDGWMALKWFDPRYTWNPGAFVMANVYISIHISQSNLQKRKLVDFFTTAVTVARRFERQIPRTFP